MNIFDIMGPIMVGPSSSHTAGRHASASSPAICWEPGRGGGAAPPRLLCRHRQRARHRPRPGGRTPGHAADDPRIPRAFALARESGMELRISTAVIRGAHPNTVILRVRDREGRELEVNASSLGGGRVRVNAIDGMECTFTGDYPTLIIRNEDRPGAVAEVTSVLSRRQVNIATMQLYRDRRGGLAVMVLESDQPIWREAVDELRAAAGIVKVTYLNMEGEE